MRTDPGITDPWGNANSSGPASRPGGSSARRRQVLGAIRDVADRLRDEHVQPDDARAVERVIRATCDAKGISPQEYRATIEADRELEHLQDLAFHEALAGSTDPGPNAAISRESMSGQPGNTMKSRSHPEPPSPQFVAEKEAESEDDTYEVQEITEQTVFTWKFKRY